VWGVQFIRFRVRFYLNAFARLHSIGLAPVRRKPWHNGCIGGLLAWGLPLGGTCRANRNAWNSA
jgi:hypothetical protein